MKRLQALLQGMLVLALSLALPTSSFANIINTASAGYQDAAGNNLSANSNTVTVVTPPVVTAPTIPTLDVSVAMTGVQVTATNSPTSYALNNAPAWLFISNTGLITGTPTAASAGTYNNITVSATNAAGTGTSSAFTITVRGAATIALTKSASPLNAATGATVTFTIAYQNTGSGPASNVVITDAIPAGSTFKAGSITGGGSLSAGTITWTLPTVIAGGSGSVSFQVTVN